MKTLRALNRCRHIERCRFELEKSALLSYDMLSGSKAHFAERLLTS